MNTLLKTTIAAAAILAGAFTAQAQDAFEDELQSVGIFQTAEIESASTVEFTPSTPNVLPGATIAVARVDGGRLIPTPYSEGEDWTFLNRRINANIVQLGANSHIKYVPELPLNGISPSNTIDEIRLTAANEGFAYVLMYGVGLDADWASFGGLTLADTGLLVQPDCLAWEKAKAKALLVNSFTGEVLGAATADNIDYNIGELADEVEDLIDNLSPVIQSAAFVTRSAKTPAQL